MDKLGNTGLNTGMRRDTPPRRRGCRNDDAVSSVVALMLLLAVIATFLSLYATTYVPGLKEQSEIDRTNTVKEAFVGFSSDIERIVYKKAGGVSYGYSIPLGAGDVLMSPEKSSGMLAVRNLGNFTDIYVDSDLVANCSMVNVTFEPSYSFWEEQGYVWQYGYINVTKGVRTTPLEAYSMDDVLNSASEFSFSPFARQFIGFETKDDGIGSSKPHSHCGEHHPRQSVYSGNGHAYFGMHRRDETSLTDPQWLNFTFTNSTYGYVELFGRPGGQDRRLPEAASTLTTECGAPSRIPGDAGQSDTITLDASGVEVTSGR